jgi:hypothetical protein
MPPQDGHIRGIPSSSGGLIRATIGSTLAAGAILTLFWLPAEYGIDATGLGSVMGLTQMGEIKQQLYAEAAADDAAAAQATPVVIGSSTSPATEQQVLERLTGIEAQIAAIAAVVGTVPASPVVQPAPVATTQPNVTSPDVVALVPEPATPAASADTGWRDEVSYTLEPAEGVEVKLVMEEGAVAVFEWTANGAVVNYDTHADGGGQGTVSYEQGRGVADQAGELVAAFTGNHGWFWRNRTDAPVVLTLRTRGDYSEMKLP